MRNRLKNKRSYPAKFAEDKTQFFVLVKYAWIVSKSKNCPHEKINFLRMFKIFCLQSLIKMTLLLTNL